MEIFDIYDQQYAKEYDTRFLTSEYSKVASDFELSILRKIISKDTSWLDVGCGTGYFLSFFQEVKRCGIDLSPEMLRIARNRNSSAEFILGDFREVINKMTNKWDVVSCMWTPYNYLGSMNEFDLFMKSILSIINLGGALFIPVVDLEDLRPHTIIDYNMETDVHGGNVLLTSSTWTWIEKRSNKIHKHLIAPQIEYFIDLIEDEFETVEVIRYPVFKEGWVSRKAILATQKLEEKSNSKRKKNSVVKGDSSRTKDPQETGKLLKDATRKELFVAFINGFFS